MNLMKKVSMMAAAAALAVSLAACSSVPANTVHSMDDLPGKKIGVQLGTVGDSCASDYEGEGATVERYSKASDAVQALKQGKIDCVIIDLQPAQVFVEKNSDLMILDDRFDPEEYAIAVAKGSELTGQINGALEQLVENGTMQQIMDNYIGDKKGTCPYVSPEGTDRSNGTLVMATNAEFEPYEFMEGDKIVGIDAEMAQAVCDILGMELKIENMEFDSIIAAIQSGKADFGAAGMSVTPDRLENVDFTNSYATSAQVIVVRAK